MSEPEPDLPPQTKAVVLTDQGNSNLALPELLIKLGKKYKFLLFKNAAAELQLSHHAQKLRFRLKKSSGEILYTAHVSRVDKIIEQIDSFLSGGDVFQEHFVFYAIPKGILFDFEESEQAEMRRREEASRVANQKREAAEKTALLERDRVEQAIRRRRRNVRLARVLAGTLAVFLIAGLVYVKSFSHVVFSEALVRSEPTVRLIYAPDQIGEAFQASPLISLMREAQAQYLSLTNKIFLLKQKLNQMDKLKSSEQARLSGMSNADFIAEFPLETKSLAAIPEDQAAVVVENVHQSHPEWNTKDLQAMGMSHSEALRMKWNLNGPDLTVISPRISYAEERSTARSAAMQAIMLRFEDGLAKKFGNTEAALKLQAVELESLLVNNQKTKSDLQQQALGRLKSLGLVKPVNSFFQIRRKPCLLIGEQHGSLFKLAGEQFEVDLDAKGQGDYPFFDYLLQLKSTKGNL